MWPFHELAKPVTDLFPYGSFRELITLQTFSTACCRIRMSCGSMADTYHEPRSFGQGFCQTTVLEFHTTDILQFHALFVCDFLGSGLWGDTPYQTALAFPLMDTLLVAQTDILQFQYRFPLCGIKVLSARLSTLWGPFKTEIASWCLRDSVSEVVVCILPTLTRGLELFDEGPVLAIAAHEHLETLRLEIISRWDNLHAMEGYDFRVFILYPSGF